MKWRVSVFLAAAVLLNACAWVELTEPGRAVRVLKAADVGTCKKLGNTTVSIADKVIGMQRQPHIIANNLETLARNAAADMHGDTIVAASAVEEGKQMFNVYKCVGN